MYRYKEITIGPYPEHRAENFLIFRELAKVILVEIQYEFVGIISSRLVALFLRLLFHLQNSLMLFTI